MNIVFYIVSAILLFLLIILLSPIRIYTEVRKNEKGFCAKITAVFWFIKLTVFDTQKPSKEKPAPAEDTPQKGLDNVKGIFDAIINVLHSLKKRFTVSLFSMDMLVGTGDAATTGITVGSAYALIYNMLSAVDNYFVLKNQFVSVTPDFDKPCFYLEFKGNFSLKIIYALNTLTKILPILKSAD